MEYGYTVIVTWLDLRTGAERENKVHFFSSWAARIKAKDWYNCYEVIGVEVINSDTGEVIYYHKRNEEWDTNG